MVCTALTYGLTTTAPNIASVHKFNMWARTYARDQGHILCDWHPAVADPASATGLWLPNYSDGVTGGTDGTHPKPPATVAKGRVLAAAKAPFVPAAAFPWLPGSAADPFTLMPNPMMLGAGGTVKPAGVTGNLAHSWSFFNNGGTSAGVLSKVARTDGNGGEWQQIQLTAGNDDTIKLQIDLIAGGTLWNIGNTLLFAVEFQTDNDWVGGLDLRCTLPCKAVTPPMRMVSGRVLTPASGSPPPVASC